MQIGIVCIMQMPESTHASKTRRTHARRRETRWITWIALDRMEARPFSTIEAQLVKIKFVKMRSFFLFALLVAAASAFVAPVNKAVGKNISFNFPAVVEICGWRGIALA